VTPALTQGGVSREHAYRLVERNACRSGAGDVLSLLKADREVSAVPGPAQAGA
jgi:adenylosuccinate lyase